jgi:hypothetical protein
MSYWAHEAVGKPVALYSKYRGLGELIQFFVIWYPHRQNGPESKYGDQEEGMRMEESVELQIKASPAKFIVVTVENATTSTNVLGLLVF